MRGRRGFTLVELVIAVAVLAMMAAVAVPRLTVAATRAQVALAEEGLRSTRVALESYRVEHGCYPSATGVARASLRLAPLTTPVAYLPRVEPDPFPASAVAGGGTLGLVDAPDYLDAGADKTAGAALTSGCAWRVASSGPDLVMGFGGRRVADAHLNDAGVDYDPTNGTRSTGDIVAVGPMAAADPRSPVAALPGIQRLPELRYFFMEQQCECNDGGERM